MTEHEMRAALAAKMLKVMQAVSHVEKSGYNETQRYKYATEADTVAAIRRAMGEANLAISMSSQAIGDHLSISGKQNITRVRLNITWIDAETGYYLTEAFDGDGADSGDKGIYKAHTGAEKYALLKTFLIPTGDDPERDEPEHRRGGKAAAGGPPTPEQEAELDRISAEREALQAEEFAKAKQADAKNDPAKVPASFKLDLTGGEAPAPPSDHKPPVITAGQVKKIFARGTSRGLSGDEVSEMIKDTFSIESITELPRSAMDAVLEWIDAIEK